MVLKHFEGSVGILNLKHLASIMSSLNDDDEAVRLLCKLRFRLGRQYQNPAGSLLHFSTFDVVAACTWMTYETSNLFGAIKGQILFSTKNFGHRFVLDFIKFVEKHVKMKEICAISRKVFTRS